MKRQLLYSIIPQNITQTCTEQAETSGDINISDPQSIFLHFITYLYYIFIFYILHYINLGMTPMFTPFKLTIS